MPLYMRMDGWWANSAAWHERPRAVPCPALPCDRLSVSHLPTLPSLPLPLPLPLPGRRPTRT